MMTRIYIFLFALLVLPLDLGARVNHVVDPAMLRAISPDIAAISLRVMAEIDGDPTTFTRDEQRKQIVLAQVLGTTPAMSDFQGGLAPF
ncbi:hypothetical protein [Oceaniglobus ichthyenteri]|uniref:hypothetical protein n=1 Tax=Oceaniglobus ichthyenteri TaxID=2136177 RepID=UPI000D38E086|nr:hypothetical protein [Oceaniglobus ichthyenteri]